MIPRWGKLSTQSEQCAEMCSAYTVRPGKMQGVDNAQTIPVRPANGVRRVHAMVEFVFHWGGHHPSQERDDPFFYADPCWSRGGENDVQTQGEEVPR